MQGFVKLCKSHISRLTWVQLCSNHVGISRNLPPKCTTLHNEEVRWHGDQLPRRDAWDFVSGMRRLFCFFPCLNWCPSWYILVVILVVQNPVTVILVGNVTTHGGSWHLDLCSSMSWTSIARSIALCPRTPVSISPWLSLCRSFITVAFHGGTRTSLLNLYVVARGLTGPGWSTKTIKNAGWGTCVFSFS